MVGKYASCPFHVGIVNRIRFIRGAAVVFSLASFDGQTPVLAQQPAATAVTVSFRAQSAFFAARLVQAFDSIPANRYGYAPTPAQQTIGYVAQHLVDANYTLCERFSRLERPVRARDSVADTVKARWPKDSLVALLRASFMFCTMAMSGVDDSKLAEEVPVGSAGQTQQRARSLLLFVTDLAEHYAQIASYMRLIGLVPPSAQATLQRTAIDVPAFVLARYVGSYEIGPSPLFGSPGLLLEVSLSDGALILKPAGQPAARLWPATEMDFFFKEINASITFTRDAAGAVDGLVLHNNGEDRPGKKSRGGPGPP